MGGWVGGWVGAGQVGGWAGATELGCVQSRRNPTAVLLAQLGSPGAAPPCPACLPACPPACLCPACCAVCRSKFGPHGMRIWNMLFNVGQLEQKQVAELSMLPKDEAREKLYAMLKAG